MSKQAGDSQPKAKPPAIAAATGAEAAADLKVGCVYRGEVTAHNSNGTYNIQVTTPRTTVRGAVMALPVFGGLMGFNVNAKLAAGTLVEFGYGNPSFIHAVLPEGNMDWLNARNRSMIWGEAHASPDGTTDAEHFSNCPIDMVEGEFEIANLFGVAMQYLFTMMRMTAGDRAAVECHLINDMVRVVSHQYRHFSGIGEDLIFDHGRPTMERTWSSYRHELANKMAETDPLAEMDNDEVKHKDLAESKRWENIGRHRFLEFVGFAGDFIHSFVTDPPAAANALVEGGGGVPNYPGKSLVHRNSDGTLLFQSVADIRLERVVRIPVPRRKNHHEDPEVTKARDYRNLSPPEVLKLPDLKSEDTYRLAYSLRKYSRWLSQVHSYARFLQLNEYKVPAETDEGTLPDWYCNELDKLAQKNAMEYFDSYACISIVRDGSIVVHDGYSASVTLSNGNLQLSAPRHIDIEAGGDIRMVAGRNLFIKVRRNVEITAKLGGIIMTSYSWFKLLCRQGTLWLRSDAGVAPPPEPLEEGAPAVEVLDGHGVMIESMNGKTMVRSDKKIILQVDGAGAPDIGAVTHDIELNTKGGNVRLNGYNVLAKAQEFLVGIGVRAASLKTPALYGNVPEIDMGGGFFVKYGVVFSRMVKTLSLYSNNIFNKKTGPSYDPDDPPPAKPVGNHLNHTRMLPDNESVELEKGESESGQEARAAAETIARESSTITLEYKRKEDGPMWQFPPPAEYTWDKLPGQYVQTLTQQAIAAGDLDVMPIFEDVEWGVWNLQDATVISGTRISPTFNVGYGHGMKFDTSTGGANLREPADAPDQTLTIDWVSADATMSYLKE